MRIHNLSWSCVFRFSKLVAFVLFVSLFLPFCRHQVYLYPEWERFSCDFANRFFWRNHLARYTFECSAAYMHVLSHLLRLVQVRNWIWDPLFVPVFGQFCLRIFIIRNFIMQFLPTFQTAMDFFWKCYRVSMCKTENPCAFNSCRSVQCIILGHKCMHISRWSCIKSACIKIW